MPDVLSVTDAARNFSDLINRVFYQGKSYLLMRNGLAVAEIVPPQKECTGADLARWWPDRPRLDPDDAAAWQEELAILQASMGAPVSPWDS